MSAKLIIYFLDADEVKFRILPSLRELKLFLSSHKGGGLIHLSLDPPPPNTFFSKLGETREMLFISVSLAYANLDSDFKFEKTYYVKFGDLIAYPLKEAFGILQKIDENLLEKTYDNGETSALIEVVDDLLSDHLFSVRTSNVFEKYEIKYVSDLLKYSELDLLRLDNFGRKSLTEINLFLATKNLKLGQKKNIKFVVPQSKHTLENGSESSFCPPSQIIIDFKRSIEILKDREKQVIIWRSGLGCNPLTLEEIGQLLGITRERSRQIEAKGLQKLVMEKHSGWQRKHYSRVLLDIFNRATFAITSTYLFEELNCSLKDPETSSVLRFIMDHLLDFKIYRFQLGEIGFYTRIKEKDVDELINIGTKIIQNSEGKSVSSIIDEFSLFVPFDAKELTKDVIFHVLRNSIIKDIKGENVLILYSERRNEYNTAYEIIYDAKTPLKTEEIQTIIKEKYPDSNIRTVFNGFMAVKGIFPFRHGIWGGVKHLPFSSDEIELLKTYLNQFSEKLESKQFHARDFLKFIETKSVSLASKTDEFQISGFIRNFSNLNYLGRNMFSDKNANLRRIFIHDIVVEVLLRQGEPMHSDKLKKEINKIRSVSDSYQIQPKSPIKLLGGNVFSLEFWELNENDYEGANKRKRVSEEEEQTIKDLWLSGEPASYIGKKLGRNPGVIYSIVSRLGIQREKLLQDLFS